MADDSLDEEVTAAIIDAEGKLKDALAAWRRVRAAEKALAESRTGPERDVAQRGFASADAVVLLLEALTADRRDDGAEPPRLLVPSFVCPRCGHGHDRGWVDGVRTFRCLHCGYVGEENAASFTAQDLVDEVEHLDERLTRRVLGPDGRPVLPAEEDS